MIAICQLENCSVTAMLTTFPSNDLKLNFANTNLSILRIYRHANYLKSIKLNAAKTQDAFKQ